MKMKTDLKNEIELPNGINVTIVDSMVTVKGPKGEISRKFIHPKVSVKLSENQIILESLKATKREKKLLSTFTAHLKNMFKGVQEPHVYKMKVCSGHFPMNVTINDKEVVIKNFFGENTPRKAAIVAGVSVKNSGDEITIVSSDIEAAGQMAGRIEQLCRVTNRDIRIFQDGCYITNKAGKDLTSVK